jgi:threonylcarbamoyladenosine tRNA methylthiotransferase MtaB
VLRRMRRPYDTRMYRTLVERLAAARPGLGLGADAIAGFPGETEADFAETIALVRDLPFSYLHVFPYSARKGTEAARLDGHLDARLITRRSRALRELGHAKNAEFRRGLVGAVEDVLVLETRERETGWLVGLTGNYVEVAFPGPATLMRGIVRLRVTAAPSDRTVGELVPTSPEAIHR